MEASLETYRRVAVSTERSKLVQKYVHGIKNWLIKKLLIDY